MSAIADLSGRLERYSSDDAERYEIVDGLKVELYPMSAYATRIAFDLAYSLNAHGLTHNLGKAFTEMLFRLPLPVDRKRRPDVSFVPFARWPKNRPQPSTNAWDVLPSLVVEVVSPNDYIEESRDKIAEYFRAGVQLVWHVLPTLELIDVYTSPTQVTILTRDDVLDGAVAVPGFKLPLCELFIGESANGPEA